MLAVRHPTPYVAVLPPRNGCRLERAFPTVTGIAATTASGGGTTSIRSGYPPVAELRGQRPQRGRRMALVMVVDDHVDVPNLCGREFADPLDPPGPACVLRPLNMVLRDAVVLPMRRM